MKNSNYKRFKEELDTQLSLLINFLPFCENIQQTTLIHYEITELLIKLKNVQREINVNNREIFVNEYRILNSKINEEYCKIVAFKGSFR